MMMIRKILAAEAAFDPSLEPYRIRADRIMVGMNGFLMAVCLGLAPMNGTFLAALAIGVPTVLMAIWLQRQYPGTLLTRLFMASGFMVFTGLIIHQSAGEIEGHFSAFGLIGVLLYYRDWRTIVVATVVIYLHHLLLGYAQTLGAPIYVFNSNSFWTKFAIHVTYFLPFVGMMAYLSVWLRREGYEDQHVIALAQRIVRGEGGGDDDIPVSEEDAPLITAVRLMKNTLLDHQHHLEDMVATRTRDLLAAKEAAEAASRAKSAFLANMSHELRTPMNGILGMVDLAKRRMIDPKGQDQLDKAKSSAQRLLIILNDILDISKIEAESMVFENVPLQLSAVVDNLASTLGHQSSAKGLQLLTELPADLMCQPLKGDPLRLGQILFNLVGNAIKFTPQGTVTLRARTVSETAEAVQVRFEVSDTGIGIDNEAQGRLFQSFEQADNSMTRKYGGTGLGLAICKRLVQLMDGEIGVESSPGQGSTFWFVVPLKKWEQNAAALSAPTYAIPNAEQRLQTEYIGRRILLVEDEPITQEVSRGLLEDIGLVVDIAADGEQALALACRNAYALIVMDMQMPVMNGLEAAKAIRHDSLNTSTPILAMTANAFDRDRQDCLEAGMNEHISKPADPEKLYASLLTLLEKRSN